MLKLLNLIELLKLLNLIKFCLFVVLFSNVYRQIFERDIHNYADDHRIVNFTEHRYFIFDDEKTKISLDDNITVVNVPYAVSYLLFPTGILSPLRSYLKLFFSLSLSLPPSLPSRHLAQRFPKCFPHHRHP